ncbi:MAG TPA: lysine--tRNA ligase [Candidatus Megaira endosymbiont of Nemacystus decipiens]|nr:lysine--tRNA ligase [Candidatus Megaera endosymbiont of Nemacystus decipiens]
MTTDFDIYTASKAWPFVEAKRIYDYIGGKTPEKGYVLFETGYGPSGLPHIGTFAEVTRTTMVMQAFKKISDIPTKLICFSDDMDGLRKVPENIPNKELISEHLNQPLTKVPDPFYEKGSYGDYMNAKLRSFLDRFEFQYEFHSATACYQSGQFDEMMIKVIEKYDEIMQLMLPTFREERKATYSPFMPICPDTGQVLQVPIESVNAQNHSISYRNNKGDIVSVKVTGGGCKLQWKPDFGMRWAALDVDYEMYGKDHRPNSEIYSKICKILGGRPPVQYFYELFLDKDGSKISKSKGNSISVDEWLHYAPRESISLFMYQSPGKAKKLFFEVIPKCVDEYLSFNKKFHLEEDLSKKISNPVYHIHKGDVPVINNYDISFALLLNLASVCNPDDKNVLWGFISQYAPDACPENAPYLDHLTEFVINYYNDFIKANKKYLKPNDAQKGILQKILKLLNSLVGSETGEEIQKGIYGIGMEESPENLRGFFQMLYEILLGQSQGPRMGTFFKLYGINSTIKLIEDKIHD